MSPFGEAEDNMTTKSNNSIKFWRRKANLLLGWPKYLFEFFHNIIQENLNKFYGQSNSLKVRYLNKVSMDFWLKLIY